MLGFLKEQIVGIIIGILGSVLYDLLRKLKKKYEREKEKSKVVPLDVFEEYKRGNEIIPIISYKDPYAIKIQPLMQYGKPILIAEIDISKQLTLNQNRDFVMALLRYIPSRNWSCYAELDYFFRFKVRGTVKGIQLEIKDPKGQKVINEFVKVENTFKEYSFSLKDKQDCMTEINEVCFVVFCEKEYIEREEGKFEIYDCYITNEDATGVN